MLRDAKVKLLGLLGCGISMYALHVEHAAESDDGYEAMCDFAAWASCTQVFKSEYAHLLSHWGLVPRGHALDLSLAIMGLILYSAYFLAACLWDVMPARKPLFLTVASCGACFSCYLLYVLKFILRDFCIVCTGFHVVNFSMLAVALFEFFADDKPKKS